MRSMALWARYRNGEKQFFQTRFTFGGLLSRVPFALNTSAKTVGVVAPLSPWREHER